MRRRSKGKFKHWCTEHQNPSLHIELRVHHRSPPGANWCMAYDRQ